MIRSIAPETMQYLIEQRSMHALLDVREHGEYNLAHIAGSTSVPRRTLEFAIGGLVPCKTVQVIVCDDNCERASLAGRTMETIGYTRVAVLEGGINSWASKGLPTQWGMNVLGKDFGEHQEVRHHVPTMHPDELSQRIERGQPVVMLDTRTVEEYRRHCIPGGRSMPGVELALRIGDIRRDHPDSLIVVNCAGRTRSIMGTRLLQRMGIADVVGLKNGTSGWFLAGKTLEEGADRTELGTPSPQSVQAAEIFARRIAAEDGVRILTADQLDLRLNRLADECTYLIDVRTAQEYEVGHIPGFVHFAGGQAVQRVEDAAPVRSANIIFCCNGVARSFIAASWFRQMGFATVFALDGGIGAWAASGRRLETGTGAATVDATLMQKAVPAIDPLELHSRLGHNASLLVLHVGTSGEFASGHVPGSHWLSRSWLDLRIRALAPVLTKGIVVTAADPTAAYLAAVTLCRMGYSDIAQLVDGIRGWRAAGLPIETGLSGVMQAPDDLLPPPTGPKRSHADMINYLRWEEALGRKHAAP
ncbi:MAG: rhodanese-like domain-containing protein [Gemmatimonadaceae bacterium]